MYLGPLGWIVGALILKPHITKLLHRRFRLIKHLAEGEGWRSYEPHNEKTSSSDNLVDAKRPNYS